MTTAIGMATGPAGRRHRPVPLAADGALGGARGADDRRPRAQRVGRDPHVRRRLRSSASASQTNLLAALAAVGIILLFAFALSWVFAFFGLATSNPEAAQAASFPFLAIFVFASSAFVPARHDARLAAGVRRAPARHGRDQRGAGARPRRTDRVLRRARALAWCIGIIAVFAPLAVHRYRRSA